MTAGYSTALRNAQNDAITAQVGSAGKLRFYNGTQPATGGAATTLLAEFTLGSPFAPGSSAAVLSPTLPSNVNGTATGTATWARIVTSGGTQVIDLTVGTSGTDVVMPSTTITSGQPVQVTSMSVTASNP